MSGKNIEICNVHKNFEDIVAVDHVTFTIPSGCIFGLIGTNGAGKSTLLRMMAGVLKPTSGEVKVNGETIYDQAKVKEHIFFISDDAYFFRNATSTDMVNYYASVYKKFDQTKFYTLLEKFDLDKSRKINTFSKGMKKQLSLLIGICANTDYLYCDETFDGLDPVMRQGVKSLLAGEMDSRGLTPIIASHNLRELEDICDLVGLLHKGGILFSKDLIEMKMNMQKVQCVAETKEELDALLTGANILKIENRGKLYTITLRETKETTEKIFGTSNIIYYEIIPLSLEEIFINETEEVGYDIKRIILD